MKFIDLSHPLAHGQQAFPADPKISIIAHGTIETHRYNISQVSFGTHHGTHLDSMFHFLGQGKTIDQMPLDWFYGKASVLRIPKLPGSVLTVEDFLPFEHLLQPEAKIIYDTGWYKYFGKKNFFSEYPSLSQEAARFVAGKGIRMLGMDTPTPGKDYYELHHDILLPKEIVIVEGLNNLDLVPDEFTYMGFPLNFLGGDGSPIRAVALV
jgi:arylformamidase